jgi:hypothetical protein
MNTSYACNRGPKSKKRRRTKAKDEDSIGTGYLLVCKQHSKKRIRMGYYEVIPNCAWRAR